jgi:hypothetical protein
MANNAAIAPTWLSTREAPPITKLSPNAVKNNCLGHPCYPRLRPCFRKVAAFLILTAPNGPALGALRRNWVKTLTAVRDPYLRHGFRGPRAELSKPRLIGTYKTTSEEQVYLLRPAYL